MSEPNRALGLHFFTMQDRLRGGPDPSLCAPGYTAKVNGNSMDLDGHTAFAKAFYEGFPDLNHRIEDTVADEEKVAVRLVIEGTHRGEFMGMRPTGNHISLEVFAILQIKDGKVVELRAVDPGILPQLQTES